MKLDEKLRERYINAYKGYISPLKGTKNNDSKTCQIDIQIDINVCKDKLQAHLSHPHIALYLDYYEFLYLQMQFEHIAAKNKTKNFQEFKEHLYKAQSHIDSLLTKYSAYHYFIMKFLKHRVRIYEIIWHIELKSLEFQVQSPFDFELKDSKNSILKESDTIAKYIDSFFGSKE
ncbi:hypothetical protein LS68_006070 [Helicobacter sp. MIT 05-5293]|uniref:hypothetical protein n=1 Tax=Helicobacter sp. MIT 05-5293 TaxID=1548149 RepID=UPI00051CF801|nr:hypothetical protein [Helicobacter sp. MIT 05-5293]TLD81031.1 hypothetical protein LS68_006070 [Helicobacter sp. MIT 05-5293]